MADLSKLSDAELLALAAKMAASKANDVAGMSGSDLATAGTDVAKSAGAGMAKGLFGLAGLPGDVAGLVDRGVTWAGDKLGIPRPANAPMPATAGMLLPTSEGIRKGVEGVTGELYHPQTRAGRYAESVGEFVPTALAGPGGMFRKMVAGAVAPGVASEGAGEAAQESAPNLEPVARIAGAVLGGLAGTGAVSARNAAGSNIDGVSAPSSRILERNVTPGAETRLAELGPQAFLYEGSPATFGLAQGLATRPGPGQVRVVNDITARNQAANARLASDLDSTVGPAVNPANIEASLAQQRTALGPVYEQVVHTNNPVDLRPLADQLRQAIPQQAGRTQRVLREANDMLFQNGQLKATPREVLNIRMALDDLIQTTPEVGAQRRLSEVRRAVDAALAEAVPDIKVLDRTYSGLMNDSAALERGRNILQTGREAITPTDLIAERAAMRLPEREAMRIGARGEIDRLVGTTANDVTALRLMVQSEGDWNRAKLAEVFGGREADRIIRSIDREAAFQDAYRKLVENSQTAQRMGGVAAIKGEQRELPPLNNTTAMGAILEGGRAAARKIANALNSNRQGQIDTEIAGVLSTQGAARDGTLQNIRDAQQRREAGRTTGARELARALLAAEAATADRRGGKGGR